NVSGHFRGQAIPIQATGKVWHLLRALAKFLDGVTLLFDFQPALGAPSSMPRHAPALPASEVAAGKKCDLRGRQMPHDGFLLEGGEPAGRPAARRFRSI